MALQFMSQREILVTYALIYANGPVHLGHMLGYIQTDIWVRFQRMQGHQCHYVCGSDTHGTPIMLKAEAQGTTPDAMVAELSQQQLADFQAFGIEFDQFELTNTPANQDEVYTIYQRLWDRGDIETREVEQAYDTEKNMFLPDRYVKGQCPKCGAEDQYGDSCEVCGATYAPTELINPISKLSGQPPVRKHSLHYFFKLGRYQDFLHTWSQGEQTQPAVGHKLQEWFEAGLQDWDISRDAPYYGFLIPNSEQKYFYVWLDAPVGYLSSFRALCNRTELNFDHYFKPDSTTELYHFIGKDITYFHTLFWPAMLKGADYRTPTAVYTHGFLTVNGRKMSKSRGTFITAFYYRQHLDPEYLRYYFAAKLNYGVEDIDLNLEDFRLRVNADLVGKVVNIASRCAGFIRKQFDQQLADALPEPTLFEQFAAQAKPLATLYENRQYSQAVREIMNLADQANQFIEIHKPWEMAKDPARAHAVQGVCTQGINLFRQIMIYLKPILPQMAGKVETFLNSEPLCWHDAQHPLLAHQLNKFKPLMTRIEADTLQQLAHD